MSPFVSGSPHHHSGATTIHVPSRGVQNLQLYYIRTANNNKQKTLDHFRLLPLDLCSARRPATAVVEKEARHPAGRPKFDAALTESAWRESHGAKSQPPYAVQTDSHGGLVDRPAAPSVCSTGARHVLSLTAENLLFPATLGAVVGEIGRPHATELGALAALLGLVGGQSRLLRFSPVPPKKPRRVCVLRAGLRFLNAPR